MRTQSSQRIFLLILLTDVTQIQIPSVRKIVRGGEGKKGCVTMRILSSKFSENGTFKCLNTPLAPNAVNLRNLFWAKAHKKSCAFKPPN